MKHSIRFRFTMIFVGLTAVLLVGIWCVNNWLLEDFYINEKVAVLQRAYEDMDKLVMEKVNAGGSISQEIE
ncbi:MAG: two-component sensor histidine kinase, partial [Hungatella sp.]